MKTVASRQKGNLQGKREYLQDLSTPNTKDASVHGKGEKGFNLV